MKKYFILFIRISNIDFLILLVALLNRPGRGRIPGVAGNAAISNAIQMRLTSSARLDVTIAAYLNATAV